ncbi:MAG: hypothetical protein IPN69_16285 [Acidobacteria bacterium]|nr:hypothetical protein [Acidobacteriota bacterium]MBK8150735.1 hypothetical protein [Acidobacteriota bacterium]MBK8812269.1 hypothetical protein [Acidobacteriota bacterium]
MRKKLLFLILSVAMTAATVAAQNKFEGYNIFLDAPENHRAATCATRFAPPTVSVTIADLDPATPMNVRACDGSGTTVTKGSASTASMRVNSNNLKWCFQGEDKKYRISFSGDQYVRTVIYDWIATPDEKTLGEYNIRDFGAYGNGRNDDTLAVQSALAFIASHNGGVLYFPEGDYQIGNVPGFRGLTLPSNITIRGAGGLHSQAATSDLIRRSATRILLTTARQSLFKIGECTEKVSFENIELSSVTGLPMTNGVEALGAYTSTQNVYFDNVAFTAFWRGIYAHGLPQTNLNWQFDYIKIRNSRFVYNTDTAIYCDTRNTDWKIEGSEFINPARTATQAANSMHFERVGMVTIQDTFGGGYSNALGGTFINILDSGNLTVIGSQTESMTNSLVYNEVQNPDAGDYSYPITFVNCIFGDPIVFKARRTFVSVGSMFNADTFRADERVRVYSTGDRFCYDGYTLGCRGAVKQNFDKATIIFMTGQPSDGRVVGHPTYFGTDVQFGAPVQMPIFAQNALPAGKPNGSMVYCSNCKRGSTPCQSGGSGAPAMVVAGQWSCL